MKRGFVIVTLLTTILILSVMVSGLFHKSEDPQLAPFDVGVNVGNAPPLIITPVPDVIDNDNPGAPNTINPITGSVNNAEIRFVVQDANGVADMPGGVGSTESIILATAVGQVAAATLPTDPNMEVYVTGPAFGLNTLATSCSELAGCPDCGATPNRREYTCTVPMQYYFEPGTNTWTLTAVIADASDATDTDSSKTFTHASLVGFELAAGGVSWSLISLTSSDQVADAPLGLTNRGNVDITGGDITGSDLVPSSGTGDDLPVNTFTMSTLNGVGPPPQQCDDADHPSGIPTTADELFNGAPAVPITNGGPVNLPFGDGLGGAPSVDNELLYFCIQEQLDTLGLNLISPSYSASSGNLPPNPWDLVLS